MPSRARVKLHIREHRDFLHGASAKQRSDTTEITTALIVVVYILLNEHNLLPKP